MSRPLAVFLVLLPIVVSTAGFAEDRCAVPLTDWQPREALKAKLEQNGWTVVKIRTDDGCYKVVAVDRSGKTVKGRFDPATLEQVEGGDHDRHGHHEGSDGERD